MSARAHIEVSAGGGLRCRLVRTEYRSWHACLLRVRNHQATYFAWGFAEDVSDVRAVEREFHDGQSYLRVGNCHFDLPDASFQKLKAWLDQHANATPEGGNRGVPAGGSHAGPDAAAGKPDAAVEGALQPTPHDDAPPGLQRVAGRQALPVQSETPAGEA